MRVLLITELYPPEKGGVARSAQRIVKNLRAAGLTLDVLTCSEKAPHDSEDLAPPFEERDGGIELSVRPQRKKATTLQVLYHNIRRLHRLRSYDLIHGFFGVPSGYVGTYAARELMIPSIVSFRGNDIDQVLFDYTSKPFLADTLRWADAVSYLSLEMLKRLKIINPLGHYVYIPNSTEFLSVGRMGCQTTKVDALRKKFCPDSELL